MIDIPSVTNNYLINLDSRPDRLESFRHEAEKIGLTYQRLSGYVYDGSFPLPNKPRFPSWSSIDSGNYGCVMSHRQILKKAKENNLDCVGIFEDDAIFTDLQAINNFLCRVPEDWDMIYFGGDYKEPSLIDEYVLRPKMVITTHALVVRKTVYDTLLFSTSTLNAPIDLLYGLTHPYMNVYAPTKKLAWQKDGYSDITKAEVCYEHLK